MTQSNTTSRNRTVSESECSQLQSRAGRAVSNPTQGIATQACRFCGSPLRRTFIDLGMSPLCETYPKAADFKKGEVYYPLHAYACENCFLVQLEEYEIAENIFPTICIFPPIQIPGSSTARAIATK